MTAAVESAPRKLCNQGVIPAWRAGWRWAWQPSKHHRVGVVTQPLMRMRVEQLYSYGRKAK